jgi:hypothetical protein
MVKNTPGQCAAKQMDGSAKASLALETLKRSTPIKALVKTYNVSRQFIHKQKSKAVGAINKVFSDLGVKSDDEKTLFNIPVTKSWIKQLIVALTLNCRSSFRGIQKTLSDVMDYSISLGSIVNCYSEAVNLSQVINDSEKLNDVNLGAHDEIFIHNKPILTGVEIKSLYCYLASKEEHRDSDTWAIKLMELEDNGFSPSRIIADDGSGLRAGHALVFAEVPCDGDVFHMIKKLMEMRLYFRNRLKSSITERYELEQKLNKINSNKKTEDDYLRLEKAVDHEKSMCYLSNSVDTLVDWLHHDVFEKAGSNVVERGRLYDFIVAELIELEAVQAHRIKDVRVALQNQKSQLLSFVSVLDVEFMRIAKRHNVLTNAVWDMCELLRCKIGGDKYAVRSVPLQDLLGNKYDGVEDDVIIALSNTERTSCMVENLHSRIRLYSVPKKGLNQGFIDLLRFYFNHTPFLRSEKEHRKNKSPAEILFIKPHKHWLEMLGFERFKRESQAI